MPAPRDPSKYKIWKENLSLSRRGRIPWNKGVKMPESFRVKIGQISSRWWSDPRNAEKIKLRNFKVGLSKIGDKISHALQGHTFPLEVREKIRKTLTGKLVGKLNPFYGKHHTDEVREKSRVRAIKMISSGLLSTRRTSIELEMQKGLLRTGLKFDEQVPLEGITVVDFYLPKYKMAIYCDGDYWHKGKWAQKYGVVRKDNWQNKVLERRGYKVFRFGEAEINGGLENCLDLVKKFISDNPNEKHF